MTSKKTILAAIALGTVGITSGGAYMLMSGPTIARCCDATGTCTWAASISECPSGTTGTVYTPPDACDPPSRYCTSCPSGTVCPPIDAVPVDFLCCEPVSPLDCYQIEKPTDCPGDWEFFACDYGQTNADGTETCYP
jgi:hypothetical protein